MNKFNEGFAHFLLLVVILAIFTIGGVWMWKNDKLNIGIEGPTPTPVPIHSDVKIYKSQEECENETDISCVFQNCDYIPERKTFEEVCGENFKKGWVPLKKEQEDKLLYEESDYYIVETIQIDENTILHIAADNKDHKCSSYLDKRCWLFISKDDNLERMQEINNFIKTEKNKENNIYIYGFFSEGLSQSGRLLVFDTKKLEIIDRLTQSFQGMRIPDNYRGQVMTYCNGQNLSDMSTYTLQENLLTFQLVDCGDGGLLVGTPNDITLKDEVDWDISGSQDDISNKLFMVLKKNYNDNEEYFFLIRGKYININNNLDKLQVIEDI